MPALDGSGLAAEIKQKRPETVVIMVSGGGEIRSRVAGVADYFVPKPFRLEDMDHLLSCAFEPDRRGSEKPGTADRAVSIE